MNKKLIAMAVAAGMAAPLAAQAAPTVYGQLQAEIASWDYNQGNPNEDIITQEDNKRGRLGVKGSEDLGGGLKALYKYEWQVDTADGSTKTDSYTTTPPVNVKLHTNAREAMVGLKGNFGEFQMGRLKSPYKYTAGVDYDPFTATVLESRGNGGALKAEGTVDKQYGQNGFLSNSLAYKNKIGKARLWLLYQLAEDTGANQVGDNYAASLRFSVNKSVTVDLAYVSQDDSDGTTVTADGGTRTKVGVKFATGPHKLFAKYETQSDNAANSDANAVFLGYHFKIGNNILSAQYGNVDSDINSEDKDYLMVAATHKFSKKTKAWVGYRDTSYDTATSNDTSVISAGLRIDF